MSELPSERKLKLILKKGGWTGIRVKNVKGRWEAHGFLPRASEETWKQFAKTHGLHSKVKFQISKIINFEEDEYERMERIAAHLGLSFSAYLRLAERRTAAQILRVWDELLDWRAKEFVIRVAGIETKRHGVGPNKGLKYVKSRLMAMRASYADAEAEAFPAKPQRAEWFPLSNEGSSHEQWVASNLLDPRDDSQQLALNALRGPLTEFFCAAVDRHRLTWLRLTEIQERVEERYIGGNRRSAEGFRRDLAFAEEGLRTLEQGRPFGYRRFRQWASEPPSLGHPQGRGIVRWQVEKESPFGGQGFYYELEQCPKPRLPSILRRQLEKWRDHCREQLKYLEKRQREDELRLEKLKNDEDHWYDVQYLERLLAEGQGEAKSITRRLPERLRTEMELQEKP